MNQESLTTIAAGGAITSPWWLPSLKSMSDVAGDLLPILGAIWLVVQIYTKIIETKRK